MMPPASHPSAKRLRAAVIGLGQAGSRFDEEPGRTTVWSHTGAYLHLLDRFELCAAVEPSGANAAAFAARCPEIPVVSSVAELVERYRPEISSICTPAQTHATVLFELIKHPDLRMIWCEKPLSASLDEARQMVDACTAHGVRLMVSYNRHWSPLWRRVVDLLRAGAVGTIRSLRVALPNRLFSIGSHAVDLAIMLGGPIETVVALPVPALREEGEPAVAALLNYRSGASGIVQVTGLKHQLVVEAEVFGDDGRLLAREDVNTVSIEKFETSRRYQGYRQLAAARVEHVEEPVDFSPFIAMAENAADSLSANVPLACDGETALEVQRVIELMAATAR
jgi:predicted dehydrogenase